MLEVDVSLRRGSFALDARFASEARVTALFGRSGVGKTTIVRAIAGLIRPTRGRIAVGGRVLFDSRSGIDVAARRRRVGYVFQEARLFPHMSVQANLAYGGRFAPAPPDRTAWDEVVELLGLASLLDRRPKALSGGERQRVAIARAILSSPQALLMDEPLASLDGRRRAEILPYLDRIASQARVPIVYVSHALDEVTRLAGVMVVVSDGRVAAAGTVEDIMGRIDLSPLTGRHEAGSVLTATVIRHDPKFRLSWLEFAGTTLKVPELEAPLGAAIRLRIRARDVVVALERPVGLSVRNAISGRVNAIEREPDSPYVEVGIDVGPATLRARITSEATDELGLVVGCEVVALVKSIAVERRHIAFPESAAPA